MNSDMIHSGSGHMPYAVLKAMDVKQIFRTLLLYIYIGRDLEISIYMYFGRHESQNISTYSILIWFRARV